MICTAYELYTYCFLFETRQVSHTQRSGSNHERATAVFLSAKEIRKRNSIALHSRLVGSQTLYSCMNW